MERFEDLDQAIRKAAREDKKVVVEEGITGQEVEVAVLGNRDCDASLVGEIGASAQFYDYDDKYINGTSQLYIPARIPQEVSEKIRQTAVRGLPAAGVLGACAGGLFRHRRGQPGDFKRNQHPAGVHLHQHVPQAVDGHGPSPTGSCWISSSSWPCKGPASERGRDP